jgi:hypothetical protein
MVGFATLIFFAHRARFHPAVYKRLILLATISIMDAPTARWPFTVITEKPHLANVFVYFSAAVDGGLRPVVEP